MSGAGRDAADLAWVADCCLRISLGEPSAHDTLSRVHAAVHAVRRATIDGLVDITPAYATALLTFDLARLDAAQAERQVRAALLHAPDALAATPRVREIPVCYAAPCGLDLDAVATARGLSREQVIALHSGARYTVAFLGFSPGFPYLEGLPAALATPRLTQPRPRVPWGSVAIAGRQAGVYPHATAGGWRILGRTPIQLFDAEREAPALLQPGDVVHFVPIEHAEHLSRAAGAL